MPIAATSQFDLDHVLFHLEVCVDRIDDALLALDSGATRIELNSALALDGLTPSLASCRWLRAQTTAPIIAMLRPHERNFEYSAAEQATLLDDCKAMLDLGIDGIAFGATTGEGLLDQSLLSKVADCCKGCELVLHRAFDIVADPLELLSDLASIGVCRILTSGQAQTAVDGLDLLQQCQQKVDEDGLKLELLPGAGIHSGNAEQIAKALLATASSQWLAQLHGSFRAGGPVPCASQIRQTRAILESLTS